MTSFPIVPLRVLKTKPKRRGVIEMIKCQYCGVETDVGGSVCSNCGEAEPVPAAQSTKEQMDAAKARINAVFRSIRAIHEADEK
jgi:hypothetical protein